MTVANQIVVENSDKELYNIVEKLSVSHETNDFGSSMEEVFTFNDGSKLKNVSLFEDDLQESWYILENDEWSLVSLNDYEWVIYDPMCFSF